MDCCRFATVGSYAYRRIDGRTGETERVMQTSKR